MKHTWVIILSFLIALTAWPAIYSHDKSTSYRRGEPADYR